MSGYRQTRAAAQLAGVSPAQLRSSEDRRQVRDAARQVTGAGLAAAAAPKRAQTRPQRKRMTFTARIATATTPGQKVSAAAQFVASALAELPAHRADQVATHTVAQLSALAEQLLKEAEA